MHPLWWPISLGGVSHATEPQHGIPADRDDDRVLRSLADDAVELATQDGQADEPAAVTPARRADEHGHLVDARRDKLSASGHPVPEFGELIA